jgi:hypothetical protein
MTSIEFTLWLKGFMTACNEYSPTPKQWDILKEKLAEVEDKVLILESPKFPFGTPNTTPNTHPFPTWQEPHYPNPLDNPYKITCTPGTTSPGFQVTTNIPPYTTGPDNSNFKITTTPGTTGYVTIHNPIQFGSGSLFSTSTTYRYPSGSLWSYTNGGNNIKE